MGRPEKVLKDLAAAVGAGAVYCQAEAAEEEVQVGEGREGGEDSRNST